MIHETFSGTCALCGRHHEWCDGAVCKQCGKAACVDCLTGDICVDCAEVMELELEAEAEE